MEDLATPSSAALIESDSGTEETAPSAAPRHQNPRNRSSVPGQVTREIGLMRSGTERNSASFVGSASGIHFIRTVYNAFAQKAGNKKLPSAERDLVPGEDDHLAEHAEASQRKTDALWSPTEVSFYELRSPEDYESHLSFEDLVDWTHSYFDNWHPPFPFLHAPSVMDALEKISSGRFNEVDEVSCMIVRSIVSVCLADSRQRPESFAKLVPVSLVFKTFDEALAGLQFVLVKPTSIAALQAAVSVQLFLVSMLRLNAASRLGGLIVRMAFHLGLHRCPARFPSFSEAESQLRKRLFWSIYCLDRYLCQSLGLPLNIRDHDVDVCYPDEELHQFESSTKGRKSSSKTKPSDGRLTLLRLLAQHAKFRGMILEVRNKSIQHAQESADRAIRIGAQLSKWWNEVEDLRDQNPPAGNPEFEFQRPPQPVTMTEFSNKSILKPIHQVVLLVSKHESLIALNRPVITTSKGSATYEAALQTCIESSRTIISILKKYLTVENVGTPSVVNQNDKMESTTALIWPSFTWAVWMSAFVLIYAASEGQIAKQTASRHAESSISILRHLSLRGNTWADACAAAIKDLQSTLLQTTGSAQKRKGAWQEESSRRPPTTPAHTTRSSQLSKDASGYAFDSIDKSTGSINSDPISRNSVPIQNPGTFRGTRERPTDSITNRIQQPDLYSLPSYDSEFQSQPLEPIGNFPFSASMQFGPRPVLYGHGNGMSGSLQPHSSNIENEWANDQQLDSLFQAAGNASLIEDPFGVIEMPLYFTGDTDTSFVAL